MLSNTMNRIGNLLRKRKGGVERAESLSHGRSVQTREPELFSCIFRPERHRSLWGRYGDTGIIQFLPKV